MLGFRLRELSVILPGSQNRFQNWLRAAEALAIGQPMPQPRGTIQLILPAVTASRRIMKPVLGTGFIIG